MRRILRPTACASATSLHAIRSSSSVASLGRASASPISSAPAICAAAIDPYRGLERLAPDPVLKREGFDRLQAAMRSGGALDRPVAFEACVDISLALLALADGKDSG